MQWILQGWKGNTVASNETVPDGHRLMLTLSNGGRVSVELHERTPGEIEIRTHDGFMVLKPVAANTVSVRNQTYFEEAVTRDKPAKKKRTVRKSDT